MGKVSSVSIQKGGPGKTTVCRNLGELVSEKGRKVLLIDNDPQGNLTSAIFGDELPEAIKTIKKSTTSDVDKITPGISNSFWLYEKDEIPEPYQVTENLYIIGATKHLEEKGRANIDCIYEFRDKIEVLAQDFDDVFIDCPPAAGTLQAAAHGASDFLIIPTRLEEDSINGLKEQLNSWAANKRQLNPKLEVLGIVVNGKDSHRIVIEDVHLGNLQEEYSQLLFSTIITQSVKVSEARSFNVTIKKHAPNSAQAKQFENLTTEYLGRLEKMGAK